MPRLTRERILQVVGASRVDDHAIVEILRTGATEVELIEALNRITRGSEVGAERMKPMSRTVAALCDILSTPGDVIEDLD